MAGRETETVRARPGATDAPSTISTTQELPPPPPGRWARLWQRVRMSRYTRPALIIVPVVAIVVLGVISGRGDGGELAPTPAEPAASPAPEAAPNTDVITQWEANAGPVLRDIERDIERVVAAVAEEEPALAVLHCRDTSERVAGWSQALVPAPDAELDRDLRAALDSLSRAFDACSTASLDSIGSALEPLRDAQVHLVRAQQRIAELQSG